MPEQPHAALTFLLALFAGRVNRHRRRVVEHLVDTGIGLDTILENCATTESDAACRTSRPRTFDDRESQDRQSTHPVLVKPVAEYQEAAAAVDNSTA